MADARLSPFGLLVIGALYVITIVAYLLLRGRRVQHPSCVRCGYAVTGLQTMICPECGSDLREVGVLRVGTRPGVRPIGRVFLWTLLLPIPALILTMIAVSMAPMRSVTTLEIVLPAPPSQQYQDVTMHLRNERADRPAGPVDRFDTVSVTLTHTDGSRTPPLIVDLHQSKTISAGGPHDDGMLKRLAGQQPAAEYVEQWMKAQGLIVDDAVRAEAADIARQVQLFEQGRTIIVGSRFGNGVSSLGTVTGPVAWFGPSVILFWVVVYLLGAWMCFRGIRQQPSEATAQDLLESATMGR